MQEIHSKIKVVASIDPAVIFNGNSAKTGATIDALGYHNIEFVFQTGVLTDGTWTTAIFGGNAANMSDEVQLTSSTGLISADITEAITDDSVCKREGVDVDKAACRYYRMKATQAAATTGGYTAGCAILCNPNVMPVASP
jgi:hypothetical protein